MQQKYRLIVLGAGFSRPAGLPLASELWLEIGRRAQNLSGRAAKFNRDLESYVTYLRDCDGIDVTREQVNFEEFMRFLDVEHFLGLRGSDTWSEEGNEGTIVTKYLIGKILSERLAQLDSIPDLYLEFARRLQPNDYILTFNYDTLLEQALDSVGKPYRLFPMRYKSVGEFHNVVDNDRDEVVILKMHGSIDWFDRANFAWREQYHANLGASPPEDIIFSHVEELGVEPLVDGPRSENDALSTLYKVRNISALYQQDIFFLSTPRLLAPSSLKILYANRIGDFWNGLGRGGSLNFGMAIIGFSLPPQDEYSRQIIYSLVTNYQNVEWGKTTFDLTKSPLSIIDYFSNGVDRTAFEQRYRFVNWERASLYGNGFSQDTLELIFQ